MRDIEKDHKINRFKLEEECEKQPDLYYYWAEKLAEAKKQKDLLKIELKKTEANLELQFRSGTVEVGVKLTEKAITALVDENPKIINARQALAEAEYQVNSSQSAEECMRQRKSCLGDLKDLYIKEYYSAPKDSDANDFAGDDVRKQLNKKKGV